MLTVLCPASRLDLTLLTMGPGRRAWGHLFCLFVFSFFWLALGSSFRNTQKAG
jgi:hypothetical protein